MLYLVLKILGGILGTCLSPAQDSAAARGSTSSSVGATALDFAAFPRPRFFSVPLREMCSWPNCVLVSFLCFLDPLLPLSVELLLPLLPVAPVGPVEPVEPPAEPLSEPAPAVEPDGEAAMAPDREPALWPL
eukprot:CAMPEP_0119481014 /NCGR_PEP_ID=MMETSP1344-20130328/9563_1 /TAXON_ID=236787 /ORGANISM="Florenciella parvula, Strain CCMP2471" /LENGTH=131 /DNA_ID=CAMNT_0007515375 /DNA_START=8 /DNA_END=400 /DNA_ORIENTATION=+